MPTEKRLNLNRELITKKECNDPRNTRITAIFHLLLIFYISTISRYTRRFIDSPRDNVILYGRDICGYYTKRNFGMSG